MNIRPLCSRILSVARNEWITSTISAKTDRQVIVSVASRYGNEDSQTVLHSCPRAKMSDFLADFLRTANLGCPESHICYQSLLHGIQLPSRKELADVSIHLHSLAAACDVSTWELRIRRDFFSTPPFISRAVLALPAAKDISEILRKSDSRYYSSSWLQNPSTACI